MEKQEIWCLQGVCDLYCLVTLYILVGTNISEEYIASIFNASVPWRCKKYIRPKLRYLSGHAYNPAEA